MVTALIALPLAISAAAVVVNGGMATATTATSAGSLEYLQVAGGQTLWGLAAELAPKADPRDVVADIVRLNQLSSADVQPGQLLAVPPKYAG